MFSASRSQLPVSSHINHNCLGDIKHFLCRQNYAKYFDLLPPRHRQLLSIYLLELFFFPSEPAGVGFAYQRQNTQEFKMIDGCVVPLSFGFAFTSTMMG